MPGKCVLCKYYDELWHEVWKKTKAWDRAHSNVVEIRDQETDLTGIKQAFSTYKTDKAAAIRLYLALAEKGSLWSMYEVGRAYAAGAFGTPDYQRAEDWFQRASAGGYQLAQISQT